MWEYENSEYLSTERWSRIWGMWPSLPARVHPPRRAWRRNEGSRDPGPHTGEFPGAQWSENSQWCCWRRRVPQLWTPDRNSQSTGHSWNLRKQGKRRKPEISLTAGDALLLQTLLRFSTDPWKEDSTFPSHPPQGGLHAESDAEHWPQSYLRFSICQITTQQAGYWRGFNTDLFLKTSALLRTLLHDIQTCLSLWTHKKKTR